MCEAAPPQRNRSGSTATSVRMFVLTDLVSARCAARPEHLGGRNAPTGAAATSTTTAVSIMVLARPTSRSRGRLSRAVERGRHRQGCGTGGEGFAEKVFSGSGLPPLPSTAAGFTAVGVSMLLYEPAQRG